MPGPGQVNLSRNEKILVEQFARWIKRNGIEQDVVYLLPIMSQVETNDEWDLDFLMAPRIRADRIPRMRRFFEMFGTGLPFMEFDEDMLHALILCLRLNRDYHMQMGSLSRILMKAADHAATTGLNQAQTMRMARALLKMLKTPSGYELIPEMEQAKISTVKDLLAALRQWNFVSKSKAMAERYEQAAVHLLEQKMNSQPYIHYRFMQDLADKREQMEYTREQWQERGSYYPYDDPGIQSVWPNMLTTWLSVKSAFTGIIGAAKTCKAAASTYGGIANREAIKHFAGATVSGIAANQKKRLANNILFGFNSPKSYMSVSLDPLDYFKYERVVRAIFGCRL